MEWTELCSAVRVISSLTSSTLPISAIAAVAAVTTVAAIADSDARIATAKKKSTHTHARGAATCVHLLPVISCDTRKSFVTQSHVTCGRYYHCPFVFSIVIARKKRDAISIPDGNAEKPAVDAPVQSIQKVGNGIPEASAKKNYPRPRTRMNVFVCAYVPQRALEISFFLPKPLTSGLRGGRENNIA